MLCFSFQWILECSIELLTLKNIDEVPIKLEDINLNIKNKETILSNGIVEARIKYESITWMKWMLKKIGIIDR